MIDELKRCPDCYESNIHYKARVCKHCGYEFPQSNFLFIRQCIRDYSNGVVGVEPENLFSECYIKNLKKELANRPNHNYLRRSLDYKPKKYEYKSFDDPDFISKHLNKILFIILVIFCIVLYIYN